MKNQQIQLASRPVGIPTEENFRFADGEIATMASGDVLIETEYASLDPYMRGRMNDVKSYVPPYEIGGVFGGGGVGRVVQSNSPRFTTGDYVEGMTMCQRFAVLSARYLRKLDPSVAPVSTALGVLGMPGLTAYFGLLDICAPKTGERVFVSGAAGPVGATVGQIAKLHGCRVVGSAGSAEKIALLTEEFGFDAAFNYKGIDDYYPVLKEHCPNGIDCYFDNVGGPQTDAAMRAMNTFGRVSVCGQISQYNATTQDAVPRPYVQVLVKSLRVQGFIVTTYQPRFPEAWENSRRGSARASSSIAKT